MGPDGQHLRAYDDGETNAEVVIQGDDKQQKPLPVGFFFREPISPIDKAALDQCIGHVLDIGAGTGVHSKVLQEKNIKVTAIDIIPQALSIMKKEGVMDVHCADIFEFHGKGMRFDTLLMLGHGIGVVETIAGLDRFLKYAHGLVSEKRQVILDSLDVKNTDNPGDLAYHEANRNQGRYIGEIRMRFEFQGKMGPYCGWLHVDAETLKHHAEMAGWHCQVVHQEESGNYLARLTT